MELKTKAFTVRIALNRPAGIVRQGGFWYDGHINALW